MFTLGIFVGLDLRNDGRDATRTDLAATERCLSWLSDLGAGKAKLAEEQRHEVRKLVRPGAFSTDEDALYGLWAIGRREPCARAARFGLVGSDGSLGPAALAILTECFFFHNLKQVEPDRRRAERTVRECRRIDDVIGRDPNDFG